MECSKIREYLSEYIDGMLDTEKKALLEDHLLTCKGCSEELASLKGLVKELGVLEPVKAPPDFLDNLHQRMGSGFSLSKILSALFALTKVKIPFQLAAATTTAVLVIVIFYMIQPVKETIQKPLPSRQMMFEKKVQMHPNNMEAKLKQEVAPEKPLPTKPVPKEYSSVDKPTYKRELKEDRFQSKVTSSEGSSIPQARQETSSVSQEQVTDSLGSVREPSLPKSTIKQEPQRDKLQSEIIMKSGRGPGIQDAQQGFSGRLKEQLGDSQFSDRMASTEKSTSNRELEEDTFQSRVTSSGGTISQQAPPEADKDSIARIAVARFTDKTAKGWWTGQIGDGMAEMLATALINSNRFVVLERKTLQDVMAGQDFGASGSVLKDRAVPIGKIEGAELLVTATITEFEPGAAGNGGKISGDSHTIMGGTTGGLKKSHIAIDLNIIDTRTSKVLASTSVEGTATDIEGLSELAGGKLGSGLSVWHKHPIEKALRVAIGKAADFIISQTPEQYYHNRKQ